MPRLVCGAVWTLELLDLVVAPLVINAGQVQMSKSKDGGLGGLCTKDTLI